MNCCNDCKCKLVKVNFQHIEDGAVIDDATEFDMYFTKPENQMQELLNLWIEFCQENRFEKPEVTSVEIYLNQSKE